MDLAQVISLSLGSAWASGVNLYATILTLGLLHRFESISLPAELQVVAHPAVIAVAAVLYFVEFFSDKIPYVDSAWDALHGFIRIPAGIALASQAVGDVSLPLQAAAGLLGGGVATASYATKAGSRLLINTSPEPFSNWTASLTEDVAVIGGMWAAVHHPVLFLTLFAVFLVFLAFFLPLCWRGLKTVGRTMRELLGFSKREQSVLPSTTPLPQPTSLAMTSSP